MNVTFIYPDLEPHSPNWPGHFYTGIGSLSSVLKKEGHRTSLVHIVQPVKRPDFIKRVIDTNPDLIGISSTSHMFTMVRQLALWLDQSDINIPVICGGIHPTISPDDAIQTRGIDMICRGEGEHALLEFCNKIEKGEGINGIYNIWIKEGNHIIKNPLRPLMDDIDNLPFPDRSIFDYENLFFEKQGQGTLMASRGCPYNCTYCCNHLLRKIYGSDGKSIRFRSVDSLIAEIKGLLTTYPSINTIVFGDDVLFLNRRWAEEFTEKYLREINIPFSCHARADATSEHDVDLLKKAGCTHIKFGLESGNEEMRFNVLNRRMTNEQIIKAFSLCKKAGMITQSYNMVGLLNETPSAVIDTIKLNAKINVDKVQVAIYQPYPGTKLGELCRENNLLTSKELDMDLFSSSVLNLETLSASQILMFRDYFKVFMRTHQILQRLPKRISEVLVTIFDEIISLNITSKILNFIYIPLNFFYRKWFFDLRNS